VKQFYRIQAYFHGLIMGLTRATKGVNTGLIRITKGVIHMTKGVSTGLIRMTKGVIRMTKGLIRMTKGVSTGLIRSTKRVSTGLTRMGEFQTICQWFKLMV
jgi:hypothetical protein